MLGRMQGNKHFTDAACHILDQIPIRSGERGLFVLDAASVLMMALWSLIHWERKVGLVAIERLGADSFELAKRLDQLLSEETHSVSMKRNSDGTPVFVKDSKEFPSPNFEDQELFQPFLQQCLHEAEALQHGYIGTEHLALAIVSLADVRLSNLLQQFGVTYAHIKEAVVELLQP